MDNWLERPNNYEPETYTEIGGLTSSIRNSLTNHENSSTACMNNDECMEIWNILKSWKLECVYQTCIDKFIDIEVLKYMKYRHVEKLLANFPLGIQIKFEKYVNEYQKKQEEQLYGSLLETKSIPSTSTQNVVSSNSSTNDLPGNCFDLSKILTLSTQGPLIVEYYYKQKHMNESCRTLLVEIIINDLIKRNQTMTINLSNNIANAIVLSFPSEIKDVYFLRDVSCKAPKGKLYSKYFNTMNRLLSVGLKLTSKTHDHNKIIICRSEDQLNYSLDIEPDSEDLCVNLQDPDLTWPEVESTWKKTTNFRLQYIKNKNTASIFKKWIQLTQPMDYKLVEIDFCHIYPNFKNLSAKFEIKSSLLLNIFDERIKDNASKILLNQLKESSYSCENGKNLTIFYLLHSLFIPTSKKKNYLRQRKKIFH
ncbi:unnamed protein product [Macrosiphum euphorbiae]|uniref:Uncharacterized protein n=1 Tax=Macrosiphum euphorbiae TaxID=13131 RepID=A0AAV0XYE5_9HEMI|nr:unnamed protein product [Macrosiphum euphorbiae]